MFSFFKNKKEKMPENSFQERKKAIILEGRKKAELNGVNPQTYDKMTKGLNFDVDLISQIIKDNMNEPDTNYLAKQFLPDKNFGRKKEILKEDIVRGTILGDIIGSRYEFVPHDYSSIFSEILPARNSYFTDDTVLSVATMEAVNERPDKPNFSRKYILGYLRNERAGFGGEFVRWATSNKGVPMEYVRGYHSIGNGCCMRLSYIPVYYDNIEDVIKHTIESVMVTHNNSLSIRYSVVLAVSIWMAYHGATKQDIFDYCNKYMSFTEEEMNMLEYKNVTYNFSTPLEKATNFSGRESLFCSFAVPYAIRCFYETNSYEECMKEILSRFCDGDTVCAIAGGLCMAYYGKTGFDTRKIFEECIVKKVWKDI